MKALFIILGFILVLAGCGPAISTSLQQEAGPRVSFADLSSQPNRYQGRLEILGGLVMSVQPWKQGSLLTVDQRQLDDKLYPIGTTTGGTFLVESDQWLSPAQFQPKSKVAVAGVVQGQKNGLLLLKAREVSFQGYPDWEKFYYPVPREWYSPDLEYWYTPPYFDIYRGGDTR
jgi:starvation-inducible outer membrane lipoprotein